MLWLLACRPVGHPVFDTGEAPPPPTVQRLGPPAPAVGIYDVEATTDAVYVTNLHVPFVTVADPVTGAWIDAIDLRSAGMEHPLFPRVESWAGALWVSAPNEQRLARFDLDTHALIEVLETPEAWRLLDSDDDGLLASTPDGLFRMGDETTLLVATDLTASAVDTDGTHLAAVDDVTGQVLLAGQWQVDTGRLDLGDVLVIDGRVWVTDRAAGQVLEVGPEGVLAAVDVGSDTFSLERIDDDLLVLNRQGAALPENGSYGGDPGTVVRLTQDLTPVWTVELDKTIHFADSPDGGQTWWTANEDALRLSRFSSDGEELRRGPRIGLTIDHLTRTADGVVFGSHLTDEVWIVSDEAVVGATCGWPFFAAYDGDALHVPCQESGWIDVLDPRNGTLQDRKQPADSFHRVCEDGLCTGHDALIGGALSGDGMWVADPREGRLVRSDGHTIDLGIEGTAAPHVQHLATVWWDDRFLVYDAIDRRLLGVDPGGQVEGIDHDVLGEWPLVQGTNRVWSGGTAFDRDLGEVGQVDGEVLATTAEWIVSLDDQTLKVWSVLDLTRVAELPLEDLAAPPYTRAGSHGPIRAVAEDDRLWIASVFRGTLETRRLPDLEPIGQGTQALGHWDDLEGLR